MHTVFKSPLATLPEHLSQSIWTGLALGRSSGMTLSSGHPALDTELPGEGWPCQSLTELLQMQAGQAEWRLLMPGLRRLVRQGGSIVLVAPPYTPFLPAMQREGLPADRLVVVHASSQSERLWATEQAIKARCVTAVLSWLPQARPEHMRRLQSCATQHPGLLFAFRPLAARSENSAAPLRLTLSMAPCPHSMQVDIIKRKGPPLGQPLTLHHWHKGLAPLFKQAPHVVLDRTDSRVQPAVALH